MDSDTKQSGYPKEVFFLGAGASVAAGVPTFANFRKKAEDIYKKDLLSDELHKKLFGCVLEYWNKHFNEFNIEQLYAAVEIQEILLTNSLTKEKHENITTEDIEKFIYLTIKKSLMGEYYDTYESFINRVGFEKAAIITTNWDIVLESEKPYFLEDNWINYESVLPYLTNKNLLKEPTTKYLILKLHGSLNWGFCKNCGEIYYFNKKIYDELTSVESVICNNENCRENKVKLNAVIIPPTLSKLVRTKNERESKSPNLLYFKLVDIWRRADNCLKSCEKLFFIGYSLPETDIQMKIFISNALRENNNLREVVIVSNPKHGNSRVAFEERYLSILPRHLSHSKINFDYIEFEKFCKRNWFIHGNS